MLKGSNGIYLNSKSKPETKSLEEKKLCFSPAHKQLQQFLWGASTSSYQVEGGITNNDWNYFTTSEDIKKRLYALKTQYILQRNFSSYIKTSRRCSENMAS